MSIDIKVKLDSIQSYVIKVIKKVNTLLLLCHAFFSVLFFINAAPGLAYFNVFSMFVYLCCYVILWKKQDKLYIGVVYAEIYVFMIVNVLCLGWDYGFQLYCISFLISALYTDFYINADHKIKKLTKGFIVVDILTFLVLRIWTYHHMPVYRIDTEFLVHTFFISNALITFGFVIIYSLIYSNTVFKLEKSLVEMANNDSLTNLNNRRRMQEIICSMSDDLVTSEDFCVAMMDIDNFKQINDTYGHDMGDEVLKSFAEILVQKHEEQKDFLIGRWGGEEFLVIYKYSDKNQQQIIEEFEELRKAVENKNINVNDKAINFSVTVGLAFGKKGMSVEELIKQADELLYYGKNHGKNQVIFI